jgi:hypothetical protein
VLIQAQHAHAGSSPYRCRSISAFSTTTDTRLAVRFASKARVSWWYLG